MMRKRSENRAASPGILVVIFLAGFTFLLYEVSWNRLLSLVLGTTITASTLVLASFMAGFGIGRGSGAASPTRRPGPGSCSPRFSAESGSSVRSTTF